MTFVNVNLHSVPFEDVNEIVEHPEVTKAAQKRVEQVGILLKEYVEYMLYIFNMTSNKALSL